MLEQRVSHRSSDGPEVGYTQDKRRMSFGNFRGRVTGRRECVHVCVTVGCELAKLLFVHWLRQRLLLLSLFTQYPPH